MKKHSKNTSFFFLAMATGKSIKSILEQLDAVLPRSGIVFSENDDLSHILCKPKILPLKSITLQKIEEMEKNAFDTIKQPTTADNNEA